MLNMIALQGRLTRDPEIRYTQTNIPVASYTLAVDRGYKSQDGQSQVDFIPCVAWDKRADFAREYLRKGMMIVVEGRLQSRKWATKDGQNRTAYEVVVNAQHFCEKKRGEQPPHPAEGDVPGRYAERASAVPEDFTELPDEDGEVPF